MPQVKLEVSREGLAGDALVRWKLEGTGDRAALLTTDDTGETTGTVLIKSGKKGRLATIHAMYMY